MPDSANRIVQLARSQDRLTTRDYAKKVFDDFIEFHGDRNFRDDGAILGGIASLAGRPVTIVGIQKAKVYKIIWIVILVNPILKATVRHYA